MHTTFGVSCKHNSIYLSWAENLKQKCCSSSSNLATSSKIAAVTTVLLKIAGNAASNHHAKQKHLGCKKVQGQSEQAGATKSLDIS